MNFKKSAAQAIENKKRSVFLIKLMIFLTLVILIPNVPFLREKVLQPSLVYQLYNALLFFFGANLIISLGRMVTAGFYMRRIKEDRIHGNFLLGITWISNILNVIAALLALMFLIGIARLKN